ncbi:hypothetical protein L1766_09965, partial [Thermovorax subterraneus]|nr:hypothetical protein [Thermovorax subterraneus]
MSNLSLSRPRIRYSTWRFIPGHPNCAKVHKSGRLGYLYSALSESAHSQQAVLKHSHSPCPKKQELAPLSRVFPLALNII